MGVADRFFSFSSRRRCRLAALSLILLAGLCHVLYLASNCPLDLAPDEAHYWDWSRHLDWSYYSKGPLVAYLIRASCELFGPWSWAWTGTEMLAVRLPAVLCGTLLLLSLYVLTVQVYGRERLALAVVAAAVTLPALAAGSTLMTIDAPFTCCWGWAVVAGHRAIFRGSAWAWPAAGLLAGLGILAKYTMVLWLPSLGLFVLTSPAYRRLLFRPGIWTAAIIAAVCCIPVLFWNAGHDWVSLRHVFGQAGLQDYWGPHWEGPLIYLVCQAGLFLGFWFVAWVRAMLEHRPGKETDQSVCYLWWMSAPMFLVFLAFSLKTGGGELNWPAAAYVSGLVLTVAWLAEQLRSPSQATRRLTAWGVGVTCCAGLAIILTMHQSRWARPVLLALSGPPTARQPVPVRRFDPTCRLRGWRTLAARVDEIRSRLRRGGIEPILAGSGWTLPGELGFYCEGQPTVYSLGLALGDRRSQYDLWRPNPVADPREFEGRTFVVVGYGPGLRAAFASIEPVEEVSHSEGGVPLARWTVVICRGYRGFSREHMDRLGRRY